MKNKEIKHKLSRLQSKAWNLHTDICVLLSELDKEINPEEENEQKTKKMTIKELSEEGK